jgi:hypothetical protein
MPEFTTVSVQEAMVRTIPGRQGSFLNEYIDYIQQVPSGQAGKLHPVERENPATIRRRLLSAAKALDNPVTIKRSGEDVYFWREDTEDEQPRRKRRYTRRGRLQEELAPPDQPLDELGMVEQGIPAEESPGFGQTPE